MAFCSALTAPALGCSAGAFAAGFSAPGSCATGFGAAGLCAAGFWAAGFCAPTVAAINATKRLASPKDKNRALMVNPHATSFRKRRDDMPRRDNQQSCESVRENGYLTSRRAKEKLSEADSK